MVKFSKKELRKRASDLRTVSEATEPPMCSICGVLIRSSTHADVEQICLICHARMLNEKFHSLKKRSDEDRERLAASE